MEHNKVYRVGDDIEFLGAQHRIVKLETYLPNMFTGERWAIASDKDGWKISLEPGQFDLSGRF